VIPACNEEAHLAAAIASIRAQAVPAEVVVVENGSTDATAEIAYELADRVVRTPLPAGYSRARNLGAAAARGDLLVFLDADSRMAPDALAEILAAARRGTFGTVIGRPDPPRPSYRLFFFFKNLWHRLGLYKGVLGGLLYCDAELFRRVGGFDERMVLDELHDFSRRARRAGGGYRLVPRTWAATSMRRFDEIGLWRSFRFWSQLRFRLPASRRFRAELEAYPLFRLPGGPRDAVTVWSRDSGQERPRIQVLAEPAGET
jgi:glycosyltransferase involved in cell wall biosynthesis